MKLELYQFKCPECKNTIFMFIEDPMIYHFIICNRCKKEMKKNKIYVEADRMTPNGVIQKI